MSDLREAAEIALEALEQTPTANKLFDSESYEKQKDAIDALRQALAQQERLSEITRQFVGVNDDGSERWVETEYRTVIRSEWVGLSSLDKTFLRTAYAQLRPLYHDKKEDVSVTAEVVTDWDGFFAAIEAKLKEKNNG